MKERWESVCQGLKRVQGRILQAGAARLGWYAALAVLLTALGIGSWAYRNRKTVEEEVPGVPQVAMAVQTPDPLSELMRMPESTPRPTEPPLTFVWPLEGEIIGAYTGQQLQWSETLGQWQTHSALDIAAGAGEAVLACADGTVLNAWQDALWGNVIELEHRDGYVSTYANLNTLALVNVGDPVSAGQVISSVGCSAICEINMPTHLHFSLKKSGDYVNFEEYVSNSSKKGCEITN